MTVDRWAVPGVTGLVGAVPAGLPPVSPDVAALQAAVAGQVQVERSALPGPQALADTAGLLAARDQLERVLLACVGDVEARQLAGLDGAATTSSWMRLQPGALPAGSVATARRLVQHASLGEAVTAGRLSPRAAEQIGKALALVRPHLDAADGLIDGQDAQPVLAAVIADGVVQQLAESFGAPADDSPAAAVLHEVAAELSEIAWQVQCTQLDRLERALVLMAEHLPATFLHPVLGMLTGALLPSRIEAAADRAERERRLTLTPDPEGGGHVSGRLTPEAYELLFTALSAAMDTDPANPADTAAWRQARADGWLPGDPLPEGLHGGDAALSPDAPPRRPDLRSRGQQQHDGLLLALRSLLDSGALGRRGKATPHVGVTVSLAALHGGPGALPARGDSGRRLPLSLVARWMQDAWVTRFVLDLQHRVVESSHRERTLKAHERRIKDVQTGRACEAASCARGPNPPPGARLVPHHIHAWAQTGTTSVEDTALLCEQDHWHLHQGATLTLRDGRRLFEGG